MTDASSRRSVAAALRHLRKDPVLAGVIQKVGAFGMVYREPGFEALVRSILAQQVSSKVAKVFAERLVAVMPERRITPEGVLRLRKERMRKLGLSTAKTEYIRDLARHARKGTVDFEQLPVLEAAEVIEKLTQVKGIGVWTAHMFLMFALRHPDVLPVGDLGIRVAIRNCYGLAELPRPAEMEQIAESWRPYCSIACWYLWRSLDGTAQL